MDNNIIAKVGEQTLHLNDIKSMLPTNTSSEDSLRILQDYCQKWVYDQLLLEKARFEFRKNRKINRLVQNYKDALLLDYYIKKIIKSQVDSVITEQQFEEAYVTHKDNFLASKAYFNVKIVIISEEQEDYKKFRELWEKEKRSRKVLDSICRTGTTQCWLDNDIWLNYNSIRNLIKTDEVKKSELKKGYEEVLTLDGKETFLYVENVTNPGEILPLPLVKDQLKRYILSNRKNQLLKDIKNRLYEEALQENSIKINL